MARKMYEIVFSKNAEKAYKKLPGDIRARIDQKLNYLRVTPRGPDTKKLVGEQNAYRTRVGTYRIVYEIEDGALVVWILDVGHRSSIYK
jgi:mRNA interferase RelE/StbE